METRLRWSFPMLFLTVFAFVDTASSQTYYYVNSINISPASPTIADPITITLNGDLSSTGAYVVSTNANPVGNEIFLTVDCADPGGLQVLVPHSEAIMIGALQAGQYHIDLSGTGLGDFVADTNEYYFSVSGTTTVQQHVTLQSYDLHIDQDSGLIYVASKGGQRMDHVEIFDMKGGKILDMDAGGQDQLELRMPADRRGIFLITVHSRGNAWSDLFALPR